MKLQTVDLLSPLWPFEVCACEMPTVEYLLLCRETCHRVYKGVSLFKSRAHRNKRKRGFERLSISGKRFSLYSVAFFHVFDNPLLTLSPFFPPFRNVLSVIPLIRVNETVRHIIIQRSNMRS